MSRSFNFYPMVKNEENKFTPLTLTPEGTPLSIFYKSAGFIDYERYIQETYRRADPEEIDEKFRKFFTTDASLFSLANGENIKETTYAYIIPLNEVFEKAEQKGFREGYAELSEVEMFHSFDNQTDKTDYANFNIILHNANYIAELSEELRKNYAHIAYVDTYSFDYACNAMKEFMFSNDLYYDKYDEVVIFADHSF